MALLLLQSINLEAVLKVNNLTIYLFDCRLRPYFRIFHYGGGKRYCVGKTEQCPRGKLRPSAGCRQTFLLTAGEEASVGERLHCDSLLAHSWNLVVQVRYTHLAI